MVRAKLAEREALTLLLLGVIWGGAGWALGAPTRAKEVPRTSQRWKRWDQAPALRNVGIDFRFLAGGRGPQ